MNCLWCKTSIAEKFVRTSKGKLYEYQACDADCAHGLDVIVKLNKGLPEEKRFDVGPTMTEQETDFGFV